MVELLVTKDIGGGARQTVGIFPFQFLPFVGHRIEIMEPVCVGEVVKIIHSSSRSQQQTEIVIKADP